MRADLPLGQVRGVLTAPGRPLAPGPGPAGVSVAPQPGLLDFLIKLGDQLIQLGGVFSSAGGLVAVGLGLGAVLDPHRLHLIRWR